jgi:hypothetical protein
MDGFLNVLAFNVRKNPNVPWVFSKRVARKLAFSSTAIAALARVLLRDPNSIQMKLVFITLREPKNNFMSPGKSPL